MKDSRSIRILRRCALVASLFACGAHAVPLADTAPAAPGDATMLDTVMVTGDQPGPGLWKVTNGDHALWILATAYPLPKKMVWQSKQVDDTIAQSQEVIANVSGKLDISFFHKLTLLPAAMSARKNPDGKTLKDVLPPEDYARWITLKAKYIGSDNGVEKMRPMVAAQELNKKAMEKSGLAGMDVVWDKVRDDAKKNHVRIVEPQATIPIDDPRQTLRDFKTTTGDLDAACLAATMRRFEEDLIVMRRRANAWAVGDIQALKDVPLPQVRDVCVKALRSNDRLSAQMDVAMETMANAWMAEAEAALKKNATTLAIIPMENLLAKNGALDRLRAKGYTVEDPE
ncbi:MAG: TraB/GumN family protein [Rudaea sp.]